MLHKISETQASITAFYNQKYIKQNSPFILND